MARRKLIPVEKEQLQTAIHLLEEFERRECADCGGDLHELSCPARRVWLAIHDLRLALNRGK